MREKYLLTWMEINKSPFKIGETTTKKGWILIKIGRIRENKFYRPKEQHF